MEKLLIKRDKGDILICLSSGSKSHLGKVALVSCFESEKYFAGGFMGIIRVKNSILPQYIYYTLSSNKFKQYIQDNIVGTNINNLRYDILNQFSFPLPPLEE